MKKFLIACALTLSFHSATICLADPYEDPFDHLPDHPLATNMRFMSSSQPLKRVMDGQEETPPVELDKGATSWLGLDFSTRYALLSDDLLWNLRRLTRFTALDTDGRALLPGLSPGSYLYSSGMTAIVGDSRDVHTWKDVPLQRVMFLGNRETIGFRYKVPVTYDGDPIHFLYLHGLCEATDKRASEWINDQNINVLRLDGNQFELLEKSWRFLRLKFLDARFSYKPGQSLLSLCPEQDILSLYWIEKFPYLKGLRMEGAFLCKHNQALLAKNAFVFPELKYLDLGRSIPLGDCSQYREIADGLQRAVLSENKKRRGYNITPLTIEGIDSNPSFLRRVQLALPYVRRAFR